MVQKRVKEKAYRSVDKRNGGNGIVTNSMMGTLSHYRRSRME